MSQETSPMEAAHPVAERDRCHPNSPFRAPAWRWRLAAYLLGRGRRGRRRWRSDPWLARALRFRRAARAGARRRAKDAEVQAALAFRDEGDPRLRLEVEARLLAGQGYDAVAGRCGLDPAVVVAYEKLFYDVVDQRHATDYLMAFAVDPGGTLRSGDPDTSALVRLFALFGGPLVLDVLLHVLGIRPAPPGEEPSPETVRRARFALLTKKLVLGGSADPLGGLRLFVLSQELEAAAAAAVHTAVCPPIVWPLGWCGADPLVAAGLGAADPLDPGAAAGATGGPSSSRDHPRSCTG
jgi:hypothetical protein